MTEKVNIREQVYELLNAERNRQEDLGKSNTHTWATWLIILIDYVGRMSNMIWKYAVGEKTEDEVEEFVTALVKPVAVGVAWLEDILAYRRFVLEAKQGEEDNAEPAKEEGS
jgi:hypothetical protein